MRTGWNTLSGLSLLVVILILQSTLSYAQHKTLIMYIGSLVTPKGYIEGYQLRSRISEDVYQHEVHGMTDREKLDDMYYEACIFSQGDEKAAYLASAVASLEHRTIEVKLLFGASITLPLTFESEENFLARVERLPSHVISDSVDDKDKMQHFFLSAYLKRVVGVNSLVWLVGSFVEFGEDVFVVGGEKDDRDMQANEDGICFASRRSCLSPSQPSEYLGSTAK